MSKVIRLITVGSTEIVANELLKAVQEIIPEGVEASSTPVKSLAGDSAADIFVALPTRVEETAKKVSREKIVVLELVPNAAFYVRVAQIPTGEKVVVFNNNSAQGEKLAEYCNEKGINQVEFTVVPYDEMSQGEIEQRLKEAKYIAGANTIVNGQGVLKTKYGRMLNPGVKIIGADRIATSNSTCDILKQIYHVNYQNISQEVADISINLNNRIEHIVAVIEEMNASLETTSRTVNSISEKMQTEAAEVTAIVDISNSLFQAAKNIDVAVGAIKKMSDQTNLLALNATIEAARAGEHGRGFGVVAQEVRKLAVESHNSVGKIQELVNGVQGVASEIVPKLKGHSSEIIANKDNIQRIAQSSIEEKSAIGEIANEVTEISEISNNLVKSFSSTLK
ncbi:translation elongation factor EF-1beta [Desulfitispora alkaliphila]|uniref:methyl-accepting chemotaxis protein n=1 Tax=Desulfitispora alkaliphila TaxID=622674 RepID=UPI003D21B6F7